MQEKSRMMVVDRSYSPVESLENEELYRHGIFEWNISREREIHHSVIDVDKEFPSASINQSHVDILLIYPYQ